MNLKQQREITACLRVADEINKATGADYSCKPVDHDPPDVLFVSNSRSFPELSAEVVTAPLDFTIRSDNKNSENFLRLLRADLGSLGIIGCVVTVAWSRAAIKFGLKNWRAIVAELAATIAKSLGSDLKNQQQLHIKNTDFTDLSIQGAVDFVSIYRIPRPILQVDSCDAACVPSDGKWIEEAIQKKASKYDPVAMAEWLLIIDGAELIDPEQANAFRNQHRESSLPFAEIWLITVFGTERLKPQITLTNP